MRISWSFCSTTMFYSFVGVTFLTMSSASGADMFTKAPMASNPPPLGAVDGFNGKIDGLGGTLANRSLVGSTGAFSVPLQGPYGLQIDGALGAYDSRAFGSAGGHLFWRDPSRGLLGLYGAYTGWDYMGGIHAGQIAGEGAWYNGRWTVEGIAGIEFGNSQTTSTGDTVNGFLQQTIDIKTRFFDKLNVAYYVEDNAKIFAGHRYLGGRNALALGTEWSMALSDNRMGSLFVEARVGENNYHGVWGGVRVYFGQHNKTLIQRHRQDDPFMWLPESLLSIINNLSTRSIQGTGAAPTCPSGYVLFEGSCVPTYS
jgi:hypothetical protein